MIDEALLKKCYKWLNTKRDETIVFILENLCRLFKGSQKIAPIEVKDYIDKYEKL